MMRATLSIAQFLSELEGQSLISVKLQMQTVLFANLTTTLSGEDIDGLSTFW